VVTAAQLEKQKSFSIKAENKTRAPLWQSSHPMEAKRLFSLCSLLSARGLLISFDFFFLLFRSVFLNDCLGIHPTIYYYYYSTHNPLAHSLSLPR
jgi:hypothetical protein